MTRFHPMKLKTPSLTVIFSHPDLARTLLIESTKGHLVWEWPFPPRSAQQNAQRGAYVAVHAPAVKVFARAPSRRAYARRKTFSPLGLEANNNC